MSEPKPNEPTGTAVRSSELLACKECGEHASIVSCGIGHFCRPIRKSKCKHYRPQIGVMHSKICASQLADTKEAAAEAWNAMQANAAGELQPPPNNPK